MERIEEIRHFVLRVYGRHDIVGYGDKALMYCKDLLAALAERDKRMRQKDNEIVECHAMLSALVDITQGKEVSEFMESFSIVREVSDLKQRTEQAEQDIANARKILWTGHGHKSLYGDDGEMQCSECMPHYDYKREPLHHLIGNVLRNIQEQAEARVAEITETNTNNILCHEEQIKDLQVENFSLGKQLAATKKKNCLESPEGTGFCDHCAEGRPELCRYMNTVGAMKEIDKLHEQLAAATRIVENQEAQIMTLAGEKEQAEARVGKLEDEHRARIATVPIVLVTRLLKNGKRGCCPECDHRSKKEKELQSRLDAAVDALSSLMDEQNGPPLIRRQAAWDAAIAKAKNVVEKGEQNGE